MTFSGRHRWFRKGAWSVLLALWLQALLPLAHHPADMAMAGTTDLVVAHNLCLAPNSTPPDPGKSPAHHMPPCPICQAVHAIGGFAPTAPVAVVAPRAFAQIVLVAPVLQAPPALSHVRPQPRGPPLA